MIKIAMTGKKGKGLFVLFEDCDADIAYGYKWNLLLRKYQPIGYAYGNEKKDGKYHTVVASRLVLAKKIGRSLTSKEIAEHVNHDTLDNRRGNLRVADQAKNMQNCGVRSNNKSGYKGVSKYLWGWKAKLKQGRDEVVSRITADKEEAAMVYDCMAHKIFNPEYAVFNFPDMSFDEKWERIGERQRERIIYCMEGRAKRPFKEYKGVFLHKATQKWWSFLKINGEYFGSPLTTDKTIAARAYDCLAYKILGGSYAFFNFPKESFEEKWERIGELQRRKIFRILEKPQLGQDVGNV
jgi:hypothetical protein